MAFGSSDESVRANHRIDPDAGDGLARPDHDGEVESEFDGASSDDLLGAVGEIGGS